GAAWPAPWSAITLPPSSCRLADSSSHTEMHPPPEICARRGLAGPLVGDHAAAQLLPPGGFVFAYGNASAA
ncbi:hypothetical protein CQA09_29500, partial [Klebsiella pneumoniae]